MKETITILTLLILLVVASISIGYIAEDEIGSIIRKVKQEKVDTPEECVNLSLKKTAHCLNDYVNSIYKYNETKDSIKLTIEELKERGGDCKNWAELYVGYAEDLGFNIEMPIIKTGNRTAHTFAIISDETGYCLLDQMSLDCWKLGD